MLEYVDIKYMGYAPSIVWMPGHTGLIKHGDIIKTTKDNYDKELKNNKNWELIKTKKIKEV